MRRLWHRLNNVPSQTRCIYCHTLSRSAMPSIFSRATPLFPLELFRSYSDSTINTDASSTTNTSSSLNDMSLQKNKVAVLSDFYRSLATQDIDRIWPLYTYMYHNDMLSYLTRKNYHNLFVYTIRSRASQKNLHRLNALVEDMRHRGFSLRLSEYNSLINWVGGKTVPHKHPHHLIDALELFEEMQQPYRVNKETGEKIEKEPVQPDVASFNILIHIAAQLSDLRTAQKLYHDMISRGLQPDQFTYATLMHAMGKVGDVGGIDHMLKDIKANGLSNLVNTTVLWNVVMTGYAFNGLQDRAYEMFQQMLCESLKRKKRRRRAQNTPRVDGESFKIYIQLLIHDNKREEAIATLYSMKDLGIKPIITIYNTLYCSFLRNSPFEEELQDQKQQQEIEVLKQLYQHMKDTQVKPNSETMYTLVSAFLDLGDTKSALEAFVSLSTLDDTTKKTINVQSRSIASLAKERLLSIDEKKNPSKIEPNAELLERLNSVVAKTNVQ